MGQGGKRMISTLSLLILIEEFYRAVFSVKYIVIFFKYACMAKRRQSRKSNEFPIGRISPAGYVARVATGDGRRKNKTKNMFG